MHPPQVCSIWVPIWLQSDAEIVRAMMIVKYSQLERMTPPSLDLNNNNSCNMAVALTEKASARATPSLSCTSTRAKTSCICKITTQVANTNIRWSFGPLKRQPLPLHTITLPMKWFERKITAAWCIKTAWRTQISHWIPIKLSVAPMAQPISSCRMSCKCTIPNFERRNASSEKPLPRENYFIYVSSPLHSSKRAKSSQ